MPLCFARDLSKSGLILNLCASRPGSAVVVLRTMTEESQDGSIMTTPRMRDGVPVQ